MDRNFLSESIEYKCRSCNKKSLFNLTDTICHNQSCKLDCAQEIALAVMFEASDYALIFGRNKAGIEYVNKTNASYHSDGSTAYGNTAPIIRVQKEFFDLLKTDDGKSYGKVIIDKQAKPIQEILVALKSLKKPAEEQPGYVARQRKPRNSVEGQISIDDIIGEEPLTSSLQPNWQARTKSFLDNELFVDFD